MLAGCLQNDPPSPSSHKQIKKQPRSQLSIAQPEDAQPGRALPLVPAILPREQQAILKYWVGTSKAFGANNRVGSFRARNFSFLKFVRNFRAFQNFQSGSEM